MKIFIWSQGIELLHTAPNYPNAWAIVIADNLMRARELLNEACKKNYDENSSYYERIVNLPDYEYILQSVYEWEKVIIFTNTGCCQLNKKI